jgi:nucleoside-diphosphate-sugar epimerase
MIGVPIPPAPRSEAELDELLSRPDAGAVRALSERPGDVLVLGVGGKMGPSLARMLRRAADTADGTRDARRIIGVSRFSSSRARAALDEVGVETLPCDLSDVDAVRRLPDAPNIIFMAGQKFGTRDAPAATWAANTAVPTLVAARFTRSRIVAFSTGNVYPLTPVAAGGSKETDAPAPVGEYAASCLGRERIFEHYATKHGTPLAIVRLNYAIDLRYGVLVDIALAVHRGEPIDVHMGHVNIIWQGDANARAIACLAHASLPPFVVNVTGSGVLRVRDVAARFGKLLNREPRFVGVEAPDALLSDTTVMRATLGPPTMAADWMVAATAEWIAADRPLLGKPTSFQTRDGRF